MAEHTLKLRADWFDRVAARQKTAEIRQHDRDYQVGDTLRLLETNERGYAITHWHEPSRDEKGRFKAGYHSTRTITARILHVLPAAQVSGLELGWCLLSIQVLGVSDD